MSSAVSLAEYLDTITVVLVDDHELAREGVRTMLSQDAHIEVVGEASNVADAVVIIRLMRPDVVVLDVRLGDGSGLDVVAACRCHVPQTRFILLSAYGDGHYARVLTRLGVHGFLEKCVSREELVISVRCVAEGGFLNHHQALLNGAGLAHETGSAWRRETCIGHLSEREREVLRLVTAGLRNQQIADTLGISLKTVETHVTHIFMKSGARSRTEVALRSQGDL